MKKFSFIYLFILGINSLWGQTVYQGQEIDYFSKIPTSDVFSILESAPTKSNFGQVGAVKVIYDFVNDKIYYLQSEKYELHYHFASKILGYKKGHINFNKTQYTNNPNRRYYAFTLNYHKAQDKCLISFFGGDEINDEQIATVYQKVKETTYFDHNLYLFNQANINRKLNLCSQTKVIYYFNFDELQTDILLTHSCFVYDNLILIR